MFDGRNEVARHERATPRGGAGPEPGPLPGGADPQTRRAARRDRAGPGPRSRGVHRGPRGVLGRRPQGPRRRRRHPRPGRGAAAAPPPRPPTDVIAGITAALTVGVGTPTSSRSRPARPPAHTATAAAALDLADDVAERRRPAQPDRAATLTELPTTTGRCRRWTSTTNLLSTGRRRDRPHAAVTEAAAVAAIDSACRCCATRRPARYGEIADAADREQLSYRAFLAELLLAECDDRDTPPAPPAGSTTPGSPAPRASPSSTSPPTPRSTPPPSTPSPPAPGSQAGAIALPDRRLRHRQDPPAHRARHRRRPQPGHRVRYVLAAKLVNELVEAADERQLSRTIARYGRVDLLCIDELGYMELDRRGAELLFQVLTEREEKNAVAIASNEASAAGPRPSPTRGSAPPSSTGSPSAATSSRPAPTATASPTPAPDAPQLRTERYTNWSRPLNRLQARWVRRQ